MSWKVWALVLCALAVLFGAIFLAGSHPLAALWALLRGTLGGASQISDTLKQTSALLLAGLAVFIALRAGLFNIGVEGQFMLGGLAAAYFGLRFPGFVGTVLGIGIGALLGLLWALPAGMIKAFRGGHEVITTIMLNYVAVLLTTALVSGPLRDPASQGSTTEQLRTAAHFPYLQYRPPLEISFALVVAIALAIGFGIWLRKTVAGYELRAVGANATAAAVAGIDVRRHQLWSMLASGAVAGLGGALHVFAYEHRFYANFSSGFGFDALGVALIAGSSSTALLPAALLFGILSKGSAALQVEGIPKGITLITLGLVIVVVAAIRYGRVAARA